MGQNVNESVASFLIALDNYDFGSAIDLLDNVVSANRVDEFSTVLERIMEQDNNISRYQLNIRDCFANYLGFGPAYFAIIQASYQIFRMVSGATNRTEAQEILLDTILDLVKANDLKVDLSFLELDSLLETPYVLLVAPLLSERAKELEACKIQFSLNSTSTPQKHKYCLTELMQTHYGRKIVRAFNLAIDYPIIGKDSFQKLHETLQSYGLDVSSMLVEIPEKDWPYFVMESMRKLEQSYMISSETWLLYRTYIAMLGLSSDENTVKTKSLEQIETTQTRFCNSALQPIITSGPTALRTSAIRLIEKTNDYTQIDLLCSLIPETSLGLKRTLLRAISTIESAQYFIPKLAPTPRLKVMIEPSSRTSELSPDYFAALTKLVRSSSSAARIDAVKALTAIRIPGIEGHLRLLMNDDDARVRLAVLDACVDLPKEQAVDIIRLGIRDIDSSVENRALQLLEERWPDIYW